MKRYYVYILKCSDSSYYTGMTSNIEQRLIEHNEGKYEKSYTFKRKPLILVFVETFDTPLEAIVWEKKIKGWTRKKKEALISRNWDRLKELSICKNGTNSQFFDSAQNDSFDSDAIDSFKSAQNDGKTPDFDDNQNK